jgi:hypothetical protein
VRFYGCEKLPPLPKKDKPTHFALSAAAWGEPVPTTEAAARKIAAKGRKLLERLPTHQKQETLPCTGLAVAKGPYERDSFMA